MTFSPAEYEQTSIPSSIKNLERDVFEHLEASPDKSASFLREPLPTELETLLKEVLDGNDATCHLFVANHLTTLHSIAKFGDRTVKDILDDFPLRTIEQPDFAGFMVQVRTLTIHLKSVAEDERQKDTQLATPNPDSYLEYLPDNEEETNEFCADFDPSAVKRSGRRAGYRRWATEYEKQVEMLRAAARTNDPHVGKTITTPVSRGGPNLPSPNSLVAPKALKPHDQPTPQKPRIRKTLPKHQKAQRNPRNQRNLLLRAYRA